MPRFMDILQNKKGEHKLFITIVFGKNEENLSKSFSRDEFDYFKDFLNIEIKYNPRLHAKYYANESAALLSSMNLIDYSQNNNIEFGILHEVSFIGNLTGIGEKIDRDAFEYFNQVINNSKSLYKRTPVYEDKFMGITKKYSHSDIELDELTGKLGIKSTFTKTSISKPGRGDNHIGYCIRTGEEIPFNPDRPLSESAYKSWSKYKDKNYKEKYCHYSGEPSHGETSFAHPIMKKHLKEVLRKQV